MESGVNLSSVLDKDGLLKQLTKGILERALQGEMTEHLSYNRYERNIHDDIDNDNYSNNIDNSNNKHNTRNGTSTKIIKSEHGNLEINISRDRNGDFDPLII